MSDIPPLVKSTPVRRRPGRVGGRLGAQKAYASENDAAALLRGPQTPKKTTSGSPVPPDSSSSRLGSKQRSRNRTKPKNAPSSPDSLQRGRQTPPHRSVSLKPSTSTAFAGATFHASPAPSALPIPSFLAKSSSDTPVHKGARDMVQEPSPPATDIDAPTPLRPSSVPKSHESPLDFMFRAHRAERERRDRGEHTEQGNCSIATSPPPPSHPNSCQSPSLLNISQTRRSHQKSSSSRLDVPEPDHNTVLPMGPAFSTPYQERIRALYSNGPQSNPIQVRDESSCKASDDPAEALKKFLFGGNSGQTPLSGKAPTASATAGQNSTNTTHTPQMRMSGPGTSNVSRPNDIQAMENDLRRILKLDLSSKTS
ncbi:hypothetical protein CDD83_6564 [Cordyceps sp. RAO-2017]|nr:hypothetical protein CDD83_6564 [Cordyceps sp. RAO-2017]